MRIVIELESEAEDHRAHLEMARLLNNYAILLQRGGLTDYDMQSVSGETRGTVRQVDPVREEHQLVAAGGNWYRCAKCTMTRTGLLPFASACPGKPPPMACLHAKVRYIQGEALKCEECGETNARVLSGLSRMPPIKPTIAGYPVVTTQPLEEQAYDMVQAALDAKPVEGEWVHGFATAIRLACRAIQEVRADARAK